MPTWAVYLWPRGAGGPVFSDTLFGAFCWAHRALHGPSSVQDLLAGLPDTPPCLMSSGFPVLRGERGLVRCYPMPLLSTADLLAGRRGVAAEESGGLRGEIDRADALTRLRRLRYVSEEVFGRIVAGATGLSDLWRGIAATPAEFAEMAGALVTAEEAKSLASGLRNSRGWLEVEIPRNHIDRVRGATAGDMLFSVTGRFYPKGMGLWFALSAEAQEPFLPHLRYLADTGIGGHRTSGLSQFDIRLEDIQEITVPSAPAGDCLVPLSRYIPQAGEVNPADPRARYRLLALQPKIESREAEPGQRIYKGRLFAYEEGSVLPLQTGRKARYGRVVSVGRISEAAEGYPVWHCGMTLPAFMRQERHDA